MRKCIGQSMREVPLQLRNGARCGAGRSRGAKSTARSVRHKFVSGGMIAVPSAGMQCLKPFVWPDTCARSVGNQDPRAGRLHEHAPLVVAVPVWKGDGG